MSYEDFMDQQDISRYNFIRNERERLRKELYVLDEVFKTERANGYSIELENLYSLITKKQNELDSYSGNSGWTSLNYLPSKVRTKSLASKTIQK
jgi:hypothetical protein